MAICQKVEYDHLKGFVEPAIGDSADEAKEALVFMVVGLKGAWKMAFAYFFTRTLEAQAQCQLILHALSLLHEAGMLVVGMTMDGHASNVAMCRLLGCEMTLPNLRPVFRDPASERIIRVFFDACHMVKLARNMLECYETIVSPHGRVSWSYIRELLQLQVSLTLASQCIYSSFTQCSYLNSNGNNLCWYCCDHS